MLIKNPRKELSVIFLLILILFIVMNSQGSDDPDLSIAEEDIFLSKLNPEPDEDIAVYAIIHNDGPRANAIVRFYEGQSKNLIGEDAIIINEKSSSVASTNWQPAYGINWIYVIIEDATPSDVDLSNNEASSIIEIYEGTPDLELNAGVVTIEEGIERIIPISVQAFQDLDNVSLTVIYQNDLNISVFPPLKNIKALETSYFYLKIKVPMLKGDEIYDNRTILLQASNDDFRSNIAELKISIHPSVEKSEWWSPTVAAAAAGTLGIIGVISSTEIGKYKFLSIILPLYTKLNKEEILDHYTRGKIHGYILANPGDNYNSIRKALDISNGSFAYHLRVLEREGMIKSKRDGLYKRFYPSGMKIPADNGQLKEIQRLIIKKIKETPGMSQKDIADFLGVASSTIHYHVQGLIEADMIESKRMGRKVRYFLNSGGK
ncbi:MAG: winged helix-turn-helix transcriptional regulator [Methanomassiliicoccales archaeon]|nr:MAG: winged helix-turn-helix transcriptional regulator [Methanomassiliicoccales archaeon]